MDISKFKLETKKWKCILSILPICKQILRISHRSQQKWPFRKRLVPVSLETSVSLYSLLLMFTLPHCLVFSNRKHSVSRSFAGCVFFFNPFSSRKGFYSFLSFSRIHRNLFSSRLLSLFVKIEHKRKSNDEKKKDVRESED